jgi:hypothetical protein
MWRITEIWLLIAGIVIDAFWPIHVVLDNHATHKLQSKLKVGDSQ